MKRKKLTHGSLFSGIGGFDLGFQKAGIKTIWQVEIDEYARRVLAKHFPDAKRFIDIRKCGIGNLARVDIVSGGFPCQDVSNMGKREGLDGAQSGLWSEYARIIRELRPRVVVVENVAALLVRGMGRILGDLAACGYDAEWQGIRASDFGAPHGRERIWIVAYAERAGLEGQPRHGESWTGRKKQDGPISTARVFGNAAGRDFHWPIEPDVRRVAYGIPARVDRIRGLGNAIIPQIAEWIGKQIVDAEI